MSISVFIEFSICIGFIGLGIYLDHVGSAVDFTKKAKK